MDDQADDAGPGDGSHDPEPVPVVVRPRPVLEVLAEQVAGGDGLSHEVCKRVLAAGFDPEVLEPFLLNLVPRCSGQVRYGLATLCLELVGQTGRYRGAAQAAVANGEFSDDWILGLVHYARCITVVSSVLWWHDVFVRFLHYDPGYHSLLRQHGDVLVAHRYEGVREYLLHPDRGPGRYNTDSMTEVLQRTDRPEPFVARWAEWIRSGRFDGHDRPGDEHARILAACLSCGVTSRPEVFGPLLDDAIDRWRWQLGSLDEAEHRRGMDNLILIMDMKPVFAGRVQDEVLHAIGPPRFPEWESLDRAFTALRDLQAAGDDQGREAAFSHARHMAFAEVHPR